MAIVLSSYRSKYRIFLIARFVAFRTARLASSSLPSPYPARPLPFPTTTSAYMEGCFPLPFMLTTRLTTSAFFNKRICSRRSNGVSTLSATVFRTTSGGRLKGNVFDWSKVLGLSSEKSRRGSTFERSAALLSFNRWCLGLLLVVVAYDRSKEHGTMAIKVEYGRN